ncbi:MAG: sulfatase-like hydrolase/transferase [Acidimicrobiia bacterium]|nr:sulfatase-like hydrolase/transferase [Acidimicrobiia bacterium]
MNRRPNILFFHIDNVSQGDFGCYGGAWPMGAATPNIDAFADQSLLMTNYNVEAQCTPTRSALMTGRYSARTGCTNAFPGAGVVAWEATIAERLKDLGYRNAIYGKWHIGEDDGRYPTDKGFDYWYGINGSWDKAMWPQDPWFRDEGIEPAHILESTGPGDLRNVKVLDADVRRNIDLEFLEKAESWMEDSTAGDDPFFIYFNHSNVHLPTLPRAEFEGSSKGGAVPDCLQMLDADFGRLLAKIDDLGITDDTIVIVAGDNGRDTSFHSPNNRSAPGNWRGGYFSTYEGNNRTIGIVRWPTQIEPRQSDEMIHVLDWFPTLLHLIGEPEAIPDDRAMDGFDQSAFLTGMSEESNRDHFHMFFDGVHVGMRYKNFKVLTHKVESGPDPILKLATPHIYNLTVNPDEDTPYNYQDVHSWVLYEVFMPKVRELMVSLQRDSVPFGAPVDYVPGDR